MTLLKDWAEALEAAGVNVRTLNGWQTPAKSGYVWREPDGEPAGMMHHHTAGPAYTPNRDKANAYAGLSKNGSDRLYQEDYGDGNFEPVFTIANAYPAPVSSGKGNRSVLEDYVKQNIPFTGRPGSDTPNWYGNTHYINIEYVLDGTGSPLDPRVRDMMDVVCWVTNELMSTDEKLWTPARHIGHGHHTNRKIDLWDAEFSDTNRDGFDKTIIALRERLEKMGNGCPWEPPCNMHYDKDEWGEDSTGVCNVPTWAYSAIDWGVEVGMIRVRDTSRDDFDRNLTDGRYWVFQERLLNGVID